MALNRPGVEDEAGGEFLPLFLDDEALRRWLVPKMGKDRFRAAIHACERDPTFPRKHPLWGGRYRRAVLAWLDKDNGVVNDAVSGAAQDGPVNFDAPAKSMSRIEMAPHGRREATLLGRKAGGARSERVPR